MHPRLRASALALSLFLASVAPSLAVAASSPLPTFSRGDFVKRIVGAIATPTDLQACFQKLSSSKYTLLFKDVRVTSSYAPEICVAMRMGIVQGYSDGLFRPGRAVNLAEAAKIIAKAFSLVQDSGHDVNLPWFAPYVLALTNRGAIPTNVRTFDQPMTLSDLQEIINRLEQGSGRKPSMNYGDLQRNTERKYTQ